MMSNRFVVSLEIFFLKDVFGEEKVQKRDVQSIRHPSMPLPNTKKTVDNPNIDHPK